MGAGGAFHVKRSVDELLELASECEEGYERLRQTPHHELSDPGTMLRKYHERTMELISLTMKAAGYRAEALVLQMQEDNGCKHIWESRFDVVNTGNHLPVAQVCAKCQLYRKVA